MTAPSVSGGPDLLTQPILVSYFVCVLEIRCDLGNNLFVLFFLSTQGLGVRIFFYIFRCIYMHKDTRKQKMIFFSDLLINNLKECHFMGDLLKRSQTKNCFKTVAQNIFNNVYYI